MHLKFKKELIQHLRENRELSKSKKRRICMLVMFNPIALQYFMQELEDAHDASGLTGAIDWENFPWEEWSDALIKIITAIAEIILAVI